MASDSLSARGPFFLPKHPLPAPPPPWLQISAVTSGAIASDYQRLRVEHVCGRLGLVSLAPMWHQPQRQLLRCVGCCIVVPLSSTVEVLKPADGTHLSAFPLDDVREGGIVCCAEGPEACANFPWTVPLPPARPPLDYILPPRLDFPWTDFPALLFFPPSAA